jgi:ribosome biogenesis protein Tsr3
LKYDETLVVPRNEIKKVKELIITINNEAMHHYILRRVRPIESFKSKFIIQGTLSFVNKLMNDYKFGHSLKELNLHTFNTNELQLYE